jgi:cell division protease FtsH
LPTEDQYLISKDEILDRITSALGGRAAEELVFNEITSGAYSDLMQVTAMARAMVMDYGMSEKLGLLVYRRRMTPSREMPFPMQQEDIYGEHTAGQIDEEIRRIVDQCYENAKQILRDNFELLKNMATNLLEVEVLEGDALREFLGADATTDFSNMDGSKSSDSSEQSADGKLPSDDNSEETDVGKNVDRTG